MFKKFSFLMLAAAALLASCSQNEDGLQTGIDGTSQTVTITANTGGSMTTRSANAQGDEQVTRCLIQIFEKTGAEGQVLQPMEGYETPKPMTGSETGGFSATVTFNTAKKYSILFWADEGENAYTYDGTEGLQSVTVAENAAPGIAYAGSTEWSSTNGTTVGVDLKHAVAKVTLHSTTAVSAGHTVTLTGLTEYSTFNLLSKTVTAEKTFTHEVTGTGADGDIMTFYALVDGETQTLTLNAGGADVEIPNVPLALNKHVILTGDVANAGLATVTFTATVVEDWGETTTITLIPGNAVEINSDNSTISDDGNYVVSGSFGNTITITNSSPNIYLDNASINVSNGSAINITGGNPTIHVVGTNNNIQSTSIGVVGYAGISVAENSSVTITADNPDCVLTVRGYEGGTGIGGSKLGALDYSNSGNITIKNVTVYAYGSTSLGGAVSAGIGCAGNASCGTITIIDAKVYAYGSGYVTANYYAYTSGIGTGLNNNIYTTSSLPQVSISNSTIHAHRGGGGNADYIGWPDSNSSESHGTGSIQTGGGSCTGSTIYCYTGETLDKTVVYDESGEGKEQ